MLCQFSPQQHKADFPCGLGGCTLGDFPSLAAVWCLSWQSNVLSWGSKPSLRTSVYTLLLHLSIHLCMQRNRVQTAAQWVDVGALREAMEETGHGSGCMPRSQTSQSIMIYT